MTRIDIDQNTSCTDLLTQAAEAYRAGDELQVRYHFRPHECPLDIAEVISTLEVREPLQMPDGKMVAPARSFSCSVSAAD